MRHQGLPCVALARVGTWQGGLLGVRHGVLSVDPPAGGARGRARGVVLEVDALL